MTSPQPTLVVQGAVLCPRVSVIIPAFNAGASLPASVRSALAQSLSNLEVIIVDDASEDNSLEIAKTLARQDHRISVLHFPRNVGQAAARNAAIEISRGEWVTPLDADDEMTEQRLALLCDLAESAQADFAADAINFVDPRELAALRLRYAHRPIVADKQLKTLTLKAMIESDIPLKGKRSLGYLKPVMRREFLERWQIRYDAELRFAEDLNIYLRALVNGARFVLYPEAHYFYRQTPVSASRGIRALPSTVDHALVGNSRLRAMLTERHITGLDSLLSEHRERWEFVVWFNRVKSAWRDRRVFDAVRVGFQVPGVSRAFLRFAQDRWIYGRAATQAEAAPASQASLPERAAVTTGKGVT